MEEKQTTYILDPKLDYLFGMVGTKPIPTKQDKFIPLDAILVDDYGNEKPTKDFYSKKADPDAVIEFTKELRKKASLIFKEENRINKPNLVEVLISFSITEKRFKQVDLDNLIKCVLDALNTVAFEDDSQVSSIIANKHIHDMKINAIMIGINKITDERKGFGNDIKLFTIK